MKNFIFLSLVVFSFIACNSKSNKSKSSETAQPQPTETTENGLDTTAQTKPVAQLYSCPMHPEVKGKKDSECPKCGMPLTEPIN